MLFRSQSCCRKWKVYMLFRPVTPSEPVSSLSVRTQTEESEKMELFALADKLGGNLELAIKRLAESKRNPQLSTT